MASDPEFLILKPKGGWLPEVHQHRLLGAAVKNCFDPLENSTPDTFRHYDQEKHRLIEDRFENLVVDKEDKQASSGHLIIKGLARFICRKVDDKNFNLKSKVLFVKRLTDIDVYWKKITTDDPEFTSIVTEWLKQKRMLGLRSKFQVYLVTGILMCQDVKVAASEEEYEQHLEEGQFPLGTIAEATAAAHGIRISTGGVGNLSGGMSDEGYKRDYFAADNRGKQIFAVQLKRITLASDGKLALGDSGPKIKRDRRLGDEKVEELVLHDLTAEDWAAVLEDADEPEMEEAEAGEASKEEHPGQRQTD